MFAIFVVFIGLPWVVFTGIAKLRATSRDGGGGHGLRASELESIIRSAVEDAIAPMQRRIETLEAIAIDEDAAQDRLDAAVLADALGPRDLDEPAAARRRARE